MSSQLISVAQSGANTAPALGGQKGDAPPKTMGDVFAALLALLQGGGEAPKASAPDVSNSTGKAVLALLQPGDTDPTTPVEDDHKSSNDASPVAQLAHLLVSLRQALAAGETPDPDLLKKIEAAVDAISAALPTGPASGGGDIMPAIAPVDGKGDGVAPVAGDVSPEPDRPLLPGSLLEKLRAAGKLAGEVDPALAQKIEVLAEKLDGFRSRLNEVVASHPELKAIVAALNRPAGGQPGSSTGPDTSAPASAKPTVPADPTFAPAALEPRTVVAAKTVPHKSDDAAPADAKGAETKAKDTAATPADAKPAPPSTDTKAALIQAASDAKATPSAASNAADAITASSPGAVHTQPVLDAGTARVAQAAYQPPAQVNLPHLAFEMVRHVQQGVSKFQVRLDPPELGRIDVNLDVDKSGQVNARLTVERSETLDLLQRDQRTLERALAQAGLDSSKTNLEFTLKQNPFARQDGGQQQQHSGGSPFGLPSGVVAEADAAPLVIYQGSASPGGLNIFV